MKDIDLIGITGRKQSGKSTAAQALVSMNYVPDPFADDLKTIIYRTKGIYVPVPRQLQLDYGFKPFITYQKAIDVLGLDQAKELIPDVRQILQTFGTEGVRDTLGANVWINQVIKRVQTRRLAKIKTVVPDVRFPNELEAIRDNGGVVIRIKRPGQATLDTHRSESAIDQLPVDLEIINDGAVEQLHQRITELFS